jgi:murein DD-endopeptidase MepM/ murein hydrolase activator NlpD
MRLSRRPGLDRRPGARPAAGPRRSRPRRGPPDAEAPEGPALAREVDPHASRSRSVRRARDQPQPRCHTVPIYPQCAAYPQRGARSPRSSYHRGDAVSVFRMLIFTLLMAVLSGGSAALTGQTSQPDHPTPTARVPPTGLLAPAGPDDVGNAPAVWFGWPLPGSPAIVRTFHPPEFWYGPGHRGVDLAAVAGSPVLAAGAGTVAFAGMLAGRGVVSVDHPGGLRTTYEPVSPSVTTGDRLAKGQRIGTLQLGHPACPAVACLHWGLLRGFGDDQEYLDPLRVLAGARVRLLPIGDRPDQ